MAPREHQPVPAGTVHHGRQHRAAAAPSAEPQAPAPTGLVLPPAVISRSEVSKCLRELERLNDFFHQASVRGSKDQAMPAPSKVLESLATANSLNLLHAEARDELKAFLTKLKAKAPIVHMSFPSEASDQFLGRLLEWFRSQVHPHTLLQVGLQPELAAGCTLRTTNKLFDFSFRKRFEKSKQKLIESIEALDTGANTPAPAASEATAPQDPVQTEVKT